MAIINNLQVNETMAEANYEAGKIMADGPN